MIKRLLAYLLGFVYRSWSTPGAMDTESGRSLGAKRRAVTRSGWTTVKLCAVLSLTLLRKFWAVVTSAVLILLLLYWLYGSFVAFILLNIAVLSCLYNVQDKLLYHPDQPALSRLYVESPSMFSLPYENIFYKTKDGVQINMVFIKQPECSLSVAPTLMFLHGNAGNIGHRLLNSKEIYSYMGFNILLVEYRGYGKSSGSPSESGLYLDAQAGMDFLLSRPDIDHEKIVVLGRSLGGAVAIHLASDPAYAKHILCLLVENTFTSIPDIACTIFDFSFLKVLPVCCYKNQFPSIEKISLVTVPTLLLSGLADTLIPPIMMQKLHSVSKKAVIRTFENGTHNETWQSPGYYSIINNFVREAIKSRQIPSSSPQKSFPMEVPFNDGGCSVPMT